MRLLGLRLELVLMGLVLFFPEREFLGGWRGVERGRRLGGGGKEARRKK